LGRCFREYCGLEVKAESVEDADVVAPSHGAKGGSESEGVEEGKFVVFRWIHFGRKFVGEE